MLSKRILIILTAFVIAAAGFPQKAVERVPILALNFDRQTNSYSYSYKTGDGIEAREAAQLFPGVNDEEGTIKVGGEYSYTAPNGQLFSVQYIADENGFQPTGAHLP